MDRKYLMMLAKEYPDIEAVSGEMIKLSAICSLPKGTEYFFSDLHGEYKAFLHLLKSASGMIRSKISLAFSKSMSEEEQDRLAALIYYPSSVLKKMNESGTLTDSWRRLTIYRLITVCQTVSAKYSRSKVRSKMPEGSAFIIDELLHVSEDINRDFYYEKIISTILATETGDEFINDICNLIQAMCIDHLHIIGDIFDRGPRADIIMNELMKYPAIDIQWGNHDISWMGAAAGNTALMANVLRIAISYNSFDVLEIGYGINLRALAVFAAEKYADDPCERFVPHVLDTNKYDPVEISLAAKMHKAIAVIQFKLEGQLLEKHPEYRFDTRNVLSKIDFERMEYVHEGKGYPLLDTVFPTVDPAEPLKLTAEEEELMNVISGSFRHSRMLQEHIKFLYSHGSMYRCYNNNLLFHGCIPFNADGSFRKVNIDGTEYSGRKLLEKINDICIRSYFGTKGTEERNNARDMMWYLWCGENSPLYGKDKMGAFERYFTDAPDVAEEIYNPYYELSQSPEICEMIFEEFGLDSSTAHIINGHVPVKIKDGESPVKAGGRLYVIDGGISKAYQSKTGIAGYTLIYDSHSLNLAQHTPFSEEKMESAPVVTVVEKMPQRVNISDTDMGARIRDRLNDLSGLLRAYRSGEIQEHSDCSCSDADMKFISG
ncbi:MAG: fructose-1,6-bisphosphatase [Oscillospiraceae bacterium]|nr:fructose-1,6-bisphosphatase [Oscillospiraceae bacterium]